jgi:hypothetical protein
LESIGIIVGAEKYMEKRQKFPEELLSYEDRLLLFFRVSAKALKQIEKTSDQRTQKSHTLTSLRTMG